jgi:type II secretory pathway component PulF
MPIFIYKVKKSPGTIIQNTISAPSKQSAIDKLLDKRLHILSLNEANDDKQKSLLRFFLRKTSSYDIQAFTRQFRSLLNAGLPIDRILQTLIRQTDNPHFQCIIGQIHDSVKDGAALSQALANHPKTFTSRYINMIKAGEAAGNLCPSMTRLNELLTKEREIRTKIKAALAYPVFLSLVGTLTITILLIIVLPRFITLFNDLGQQLPVPTQILLSTSSFLSKFGWLAIIFIAPLIIFSKQIAKIDCVKQFLDEFFLHLPLFGNLIKKREIARFCRSLGTLLDNGLPLSIALKIVHDISLNSVFKNHISKMLSNVKQGANLASSINNAKLFPPMICSMVAIGEETNELHNILLQTALEYDADIDQNIKIAMSLLEPIIILLVGSIVGFIVISMLLPIFNLSSSIR